MKLDRGELFASLKEIHSVLSDVFDKSGKNFCGDCHFCCSHTYQHGVCQIEYDYIEKYLSEKGMPYGAKKFRDYIRKKRNIYGTLIYTGCPLYDTSAGGCSIYPVRPFSCRIYGPYGKTPHPLFCSFYLHSVIYSNKSFYDIVPMAEEFFEVKNLYDILVEKSDIKKSEKFYTLGIHFYYRGNMDRTEPFLREAISCNPANSDAYYQLGLLNSLRGNMEEAIENIEKAIEHNPSDISFRTQLGLFLMLKGNYMRAGREFEQVILEDPWNKMALTGLANVFLTMGNHEEARTYSSRVLDRYPDFLPARRILENVMGDG